MSLALSPRRLLYLSKRVRVGWLRDESVCEYVNVNMCMYVRINVHTAREYNQVRSHCKLTL